ncbi:hypothetical protein AKJ57_06095 [candidate division MSBL1 archaeon SCGC-AAA259A05]|uniref:Uncharacterized protein n=1 Tax=candidate division MSBL1 archaeon SCGC-AAA259A05 TaxID=1698259 RepID=A0A133U435_9EURY|nr:hypothetical protein AKJ57_06095 [candidate division MSBL1 archaeon SCGC-AAA259A05]
MADSNQDAPEQEKSEEEKRKEYFEELGVEPKRTEEFEREDSGVPVVEPDEEEEKERKERKEKELEEYQKKTGF